MSRSPGSDLLPPALGLLPRIPRARAATLESALALRPGVAGERFAVGAATLSLLAAYAEESPVLMLIDDAHLLDASTAEALRFALRRLVAERLGALLASVKAKPRLSTMLICQCCMLVVSMSVLWRAARRSRRRIQLNVSFAQRPAIRLP